MRRSRQSWSNASNATATVIPNLFSADEVALFRAELERMRQDPAVAGSGKTIKEPDSGAIRSVFAIHKDNELFARVAADERTAGIARFILAATCTCISRE